MRVTEKECPYLCFYKSYFDVLKPYSDEERGRLITGMMEYMYYGIDPEFEGNERFVWGLLKWNIDRDVEAYSSRCEASRRNGKKGGRPKATVTQETDGFSEEPEKANKKESENKKDMPQNAAAAVAHTPFTIPDEKDITDYCLENQLWINAKRFVEYYEARGWRLGGEPIHDWRPLVRSWADTEYDPENPYASTLALIEKYKREQAQG